MKHLSIPFETSGEIRLLRNKQLILNLPVEVGLSLIEHFQGLLYRTEIKKGTGLLFIFENPNLPSLVNFCAQFDAESIQIDEDGKISYIAKIAASKGNASFVTAFQCKYLLIVENGFCEKHSIETYNYECSNNLEPAKVEINLKNKITRAQLIEAFESTNFNVFEPSLTIKTGKYNAALDNLLLKNNKTEWAFITPCNPESRVLTEDENNHRFNELKEKLSDYIFFEGEGVGTDTSWKPERSFLILGITKSKAIELGNEYEQIAIVYGSITPLPELLILR